MVRGKVTGDDGVEASHIYDLLVFKLNMDAEIIASIISMERFISRQTQNTYMISLCPK